MSDSLSVMLVKECPGVMTGIGARGSPFGYSDALTLSLRSIAASWSCGSPPSRQRRVRVAAPRQVRRPRPRAEVLEQPVVAQLRLQLHDAALRIVQIAEHDRVGRADLLAGRPDVAVADLPPFRLRIDPRLVDALHAVGALLHHAAAADRHVGIALRLQLFGRKVG